MAVQKSSDRLNWDDLRYFSALADTGRISKAATRLGVNHVTVSRRIDRLEDTLKRTLFARSNDGYTLTVEGNDLLIRLNTISPTLEEIGGTAENTEAAKKTVKLSMVHSLAEFVVVPALAKFRKQHPNLKFELDTSSRNVSIVKRESDLALRLALPESGDFLTRRLGNLAYVLCGTDELAARCEEGKPVPIVTYDQSLSKLPEAKYMQAHFGIGSIALQSNSATVQRSAAMSGFGIAVLPRYLVRGSGLTEISMHEQVQRELWLLTRKTTSQLTDVRLVIDALADVFK